MYHASRTWHRRLGAIAAAFLVVIAATGFLLANKPRFAWMRPPEAKGGDFERLDEVISLDRAARAAFALGHPELQTHQDVDRIDYRPKRNIFKVVSKEGYREVQVDGKSGAVLSSSFRTDQLTEKIHDLSFFGDLFHAWVLPSVAIVLFFLGLSGVYMYFVPVWRRAVFRRRRDRP